MSILASILDPGDNGYDINDLSILLGIIITISITTATVVRWNAARVARVRAKERADLEQRILDAIAEHTKPIQPGYRNGGESLGDIGAFARILMDRQVDVIRDVRAVRERLDQHIDNHEKD